jgi:hypothetical protein
MQENARAAQILSLGRSDDQAAAALADVYREAKEVFESHPDASAKAGERIVSALRDSPEAAPLWIFAQAFTLFSEGIAAGRGQRWIQPEDVQQARGLICEFPECPFERVSAALETLRLMTTATTAEEEEEAGTART